MVEKIGLEEVEERGMESELPPYEPPKVVTYRDDDLLAELGPALACSFGHSVIQCEEASPWESWRVP